jgi:hypothetical protein
MFCLLLILSGSALHASVEEVPRCWVEDLPSEDIQDGLFRVQIVTAGTSAREVAAVMAILSQSLAFQKGVAPSNDLEHLEVDVFGETKYWQPTAAFPTLESYKSAIVNSLTPVLKFNAAIECAKNNRHSH